MTSFILRTAENKAYMIGEVAKLLVDSDKPLQVTVSYYKKVRSIPQNKLLHAWCKVIAYELTKRQQELVCPKKVKTDIKNNFGLKSSSFDAITGRERPYLVSTTEYSTIEMSEMLIKTELWCIDNDIILAYDTCKVYTEYREARL